MSTKKDKPKNFVVEPRDNDTAKEMYAKVGPRTIQFGHKVTLTPSEVKVLEGQKNPAKSIGRKSPMDIARDRGITLDEATEMAAEMPNSPESIKWVPKYIVQAVA